MSQIYLSAQIIYLFIYNLWQLEINLLMAMIVSYNPSADCFFLERWIESLPLCYLTCFPYIVGDSSHSFLLLACDRYFFEEDGSIS